ncbi:ABC transporter ATP-binding protein, partial [Escherichia coli]|nr:ABC transporter ATP-binding protein [Escherichia coli]
RFWLIDENGLSEWHDVDEVYARLRGYERLQSPATQTPPQATTVDDMQEDLLERLVMLEQLLADDLQRKPKHQKPQLQALWRQEI